MFGKTYGKLTKMAKTGEVELGNELSVQTRYTSILKDAFNDIENAKKPGGGIYKDLPFKTEHIAVRKRRIFIWNLKKKQANGNTRMGKMEANIFWKSYSP